MNTSSLKPGDRVGWSGGQRSCRVGGVGTVRAVSPKGYITLADGKRFTPFGRQVGESEGRLESVAEGEKLGQLTTYRTALTELRERVVRITTDHGGVHYARTASPLTPNERAEILALVDRCSADPTSQRM